jgi:hypothetical protein
MKETSWLMGGKEGFPATAAAVYRNVVRLTVHKRGEKELKEGEKE